MRYDEHVARLTAALLGPGATTAQELRRALIERRMSGVPDALSPYVDKVATRAYAVTDNDVDSLKSAGLSEDEIFEITAAAAVGAALYRMDRAFAVLKEGQA